VTGWATLQVGEAGHQGVGVRLGQVEQPAAQHLHDRQQVVDLGAQPQAHVGGDLVVAGARGVQSLAGIAHELGQAVLDIEWTSSRSIDQAKVPARTLSSTCAMPRSIAFRSSAEMSSGARQHAGVGKRALDVELGEALVETDRGVEALGERIEGLGEPSRPRLARFRAAGLVVWLHGSGGDGPIGDVASINQTGAGIRLPNFCNLGVMLRSLVIANLFVLAAALCARADPTALARVPRSPRFCEPAADREPRSCCARAPPAALDGLRRVARGDRVFEVALAWCVTRLAPSCCPAAPMPFAHVALLTLFVTGCLLAYFDLRARALSPAIAEARIQALQARIRPHFLYNSINAVLSLIRSEPRRAERALEDMADLFRVLMADNRTLAPIADEVELARQYLAIESIRLGDRLQGDLAHRRHAGRRARAAADAAAAGRERRLPRHRALGRGRRDRDRRRLAGKQLR
jgi:hypothetical protein